jgi:hypothetical protein
MKNPLRIFSLNTEYWKYSDTLIPYISTLPTDIDIFCFQEVPNNAKNIQCFEESFDIYLYQKLCIALPEYIPYYAEYVHESFGIVTFVHRSLAQQYIGESYIFGDSGVPFLDQWEYNAHTKCLWVYVEWVYIVNLHGAWQPWTKKRDTPERILQSENILKFCKGVTKNTVLIWDFNLMPDTKSVSMLEEKFTNLISRYGITDTRTAVYTKKQRYADYVFVWKNIHVEDFGVYLEPIYSDHGYMRVSVSLV